MATTHPSTAATSAGRDASSAGVLAHVDGTIVVLGLGSIGRGLLPLLRRHLTCASRLVVIDAVDREADRLVAERNYGAQFMHVFIGAHNYESVLGPLLREGNANGFLVNLGLNMNSVALMRLSRECGAMYIDTDSDVWNEDFQVLYHGQRDTNILFCNLPSFFCWYPFCPLLLVVRLPHFHISILF
jgi:homospermidine synthase